MSNLEFYLFSLTLTAERRRGHLSSVVMGDEDLPNATPVAGVLVGHGIVLAAFGIYGAALHGFAPKVMHSVYAGVGSAAVLSVCGALSIGGTRKLYMIGVHLGLLAQLLFTGVFTMQAYKNYGVPEKADRFKLFVGMGLSGVIALGLMRALKPKPKKK